MVDLILTLLLAMIASVVAIMQGVQHSVFSLITVYWLVLAAKNWLLVAAGEEREETKWLNLPKS